MLSFNNAANGSSRRVKRSTPTQTTMLAPAANTNHQRDWSIRADSNPAAPTLARYPITNGTPMIAPRSIAAATGRARHRSPSTGPESATTRSVPRVRAGRNGSVCRPIGPKPHELSNQTPSFGVNLTTTDTKGGESRPSVDPGTRDTKHRASRMMSSLASGGSAGPARSSSFWADAQTFRRPGNSAPTAMWSTPMSMTRRRSGNVHPRTSVLICAPPKTGTAAAQERGTRHGECPRWVAGHPSVREGVEFERGSGGRGCGRS